MTRSIRKHLAEKSVGSRTGFRWRGGKEISRLEGFTDAVFAFAVTLLVVSLEVPKSYTELMKTMQGFIAFAICFLLLFAIWYQQYVFFRRYGLEDLFVVWMNGILIFVVLFYVYPLKFLFTSLVDEIRGRSTVDIDLVQMSRLFLIFSSGYVAVFLIFALLFGHAYRKRDELELNALERFDTRESIWSAALQIVVGVASLLIAGLAPSRYAPWAGMIYFANAPIQTIRGTVFGAHRKRLERLANV